MAALDERALTARLLQRTGFGARTDEMEAAAKNGFSATVNQVRRGGTDSGAEATPQPALGALPERGKRGDQEARQSYQRAVRAQREAAITWWLERMAAVERPWAEKRTVLWHDHWATSIQKVQSGAAMLEQNETLRRLGGGDFMVLARAMLRDPALLIWLDASKNSARAPNENLAREFMELFVLGVGNYTENDVKAVAAALTGWVVNRRGTPKPVFRPRRHARGNQTILGRTADFSPDDLIAHLLARPASPRHVVSRFWARLVSSDTRPSAQAMERMVGVYGAERDVTALLHAMFTDPAFADPRNVLVKQPIEYVVGALRAFRVRPGELEQQQRKMIHRTLNGLGQTPFAPPSVGGWPHGGAWLTTAAARVRMNFAQQLTGWADLSEVKRAPAVQRPEVLSRILGVTWGETTTGALAKAGADPRRVTAIALNAPEHLVQA